MKVRIKTNNYVGRRTRRIQQQLQLVPRQAYDYFKSITPIDTGNARRKTGFKRGNTIHAEYPYAKRLDEGWSKQAKKGMIKPTLSFIRRKIKQIVAGK